MRAKEYLIKHRQDLKHTAILQKAIDELLPLRRSKTATNDYVDNYLSADIRYRQYLSNKELFERGNVIQCESPKLEIVETEISREISAEVRNEILQVIQGDMSFGYLYYILGSEYNSHHCDEPLDCIPNTKQILQHITDCRDDYPKYELDSFINEDLNYRQYCILRDGNYWEDRDELYLKYFNRVYQIYDELRLLRDSITEVKKYIKKQVFDNKAEKYWTYTFIITLIESSKIEEESLNRCKSELEREVTPLREFVLSRPAEPSQSPVWLVERTGAKIDIIRVLNVLFEMGMFTGEGGKKISKKDFMVAMGKSMNIDLSNYDKDLSRSLSDSTKLEKHQKIFQTMLQKMTDIFENFLNKH